MVGTLSYIKLNTKNKATPNGDQIVFGKYVNKKINYINKSVTPKQLETFGKYLKEFIEKYKK